MSPVSSRMDGGSEFSDDVSAASSVPWGGRGKAAASSFPGSTGEMMGIKVGGNAVAKSALTTASVVKPVPGSKGMCFPFWFYSGWVFACSSLLGNGHRSSLQITE